MVRGPRSIISGTLIAASIAGCIITVVATGPAAAGPAPAVVPGTVQFSSVVIRYGPGFLLGFAGLLALGRLAGRFGRSELRLARIAARRHRDRMDRNDTLRRATVALDAVSDAVIRLRHGDCIEYLNRAAVELLEADSQPVTGRPLTELAWLVGDDGAGLVIPPDSDAPLPDGTRLQLAGGSCIEVQGKRVDGGSTLVLRRANPSATGSATEPLRRDPLTGALDRHGLEQVVGQPPAGGAEQGTLLYLDVDRFELVNDLCGHDTADRFLVELTACLRGAVRQSDAIARISGDEFAILLRGTGVSTAMTIADKVRRVVHRHHFNWEQRRIQLAVSIGLADCNVADSVAALIDAARRACDLAKQGGRNRCYLYRPDDSRIVAYEQAMRWVSVLERALQDGRFRLYCQAIVALEPDTEPDCYEFLLRLQDDKGRLVAPGEFIPAAERYQLMPRIDRWVLRNALRFIADPANCIPPVTRYAINLSGQSLNDEGFAAYVKNEIRNSGVDPGRLCFEVTETAVVGNLETARSFITALRQLGCRFSLDDFGSGMSSFAYLRDLKVDYLKIDGRFVRRIDEDRHDCALVEAIQRMGRVLGIRTTAEFVENDSIRQRLRAMGVDYGQGYGIERPRPVTGFLRSGRQRVVNS